MLDVSSEDLTEGPLLRGLLVLAAPLLVQNLVMVGNQVVDLFWLGRFAGDAVAAVGLAFPLVSLLYALTIWAPFVGTQVIVSQRVGADDAGGARAATSTGLLVATVLGVVIGAAAYLSVPPLVDALTAVDPGATGDAVREYAVTYLRVIALGLVAIALADTVEAAFVGYGDSRTSLGINVVTVAVNLTLDPLLIFGLFGFPELGIAGAALATVVSSGVGLAFGLAVAATGRNDRMFTQAAAARVDAAEVRELLDVGAPNAAQHTVRQVVGLAIVVVTFAAGGAAGLSAYYLGAQVATVSFVPAIGLQQATQSVVGQNLGAGRPERASRATWLGVWLAAVGLAVVGVLQWFVPGLVVDALAPEFDALATGYSMDYLRILALGYPAIGAAYLLEAGFNGARRTRTSFAATMLQFWVVRLPIAVVGAFWLGFGVHAVFWAVTLSNVAAAVGLAAFYRYSVADGMLTRAAETAVPGD